MTPRPIRVVLASLVTLVLASCGSDSTAPGDGGTTLPPGLTLKVDPFITSGLSGPVFLTQPLNDGRIFVVEQAGRIRLVKNGALQTTPFLDISSRVLSGGERGLLSVAFHPQYATNHYFYVYFTSQTTGDIRIERFTTTTNADVADPATTKLIFTTPHPNINHNGGLVSFGPDGMLYAAFGDGGGGSPDQAGNGQNQNAYLAGIIRVNVDVGDPYSVPANNPFVGQANKKPELWAKGLRNPWRYAFDAATSLLYVADVGESAREEVDAVSATQGGINYGWSIMEGTTCFGATTCSQSGLTLPILDYGHTGGACSITGGYVYRGSAIPGIRGHYFYSDYCAGFLRSLRYENGVAVDQKDWGITMSQVTSFGVDVAGELYIMSANSVLKVAPGS